MVTQDDIEPFLLARIAEDADEIDRSRISESPDWWEPAQWNLARALAEVQSKRAIVRWAQSWPLRPASAGAGVDAGNTVMRLLAAVYADHPDYREEWRP